MTARLNSPSAKDIAYSIHPYANLKLHQNEGPLIIERGEGVYVYDDAGKQYIEAVASLWYASLGFSEQRLVEAAYEQMKKLPCYHSFGHKATMPSIELAERLVAMAPKELTKAFFANSGSEANDTAIKIVRYYNNAIDRPRKKKIISRFKAYHGSTVAAASVTGVPRNHWDFDLPIEGIIHTDCPDHYRYGEEGETEEAFADRLAQNLEDLIVCEDPDTVAAFFAEPVMGAGGILIPPAGYFDKIQAVLRKHDVLLVVDEVICGFGRLGTMFGCETFGLSPDIMTVAKALSSGYQPISAVLVSDAIYQAMVDESEKLGVFGHGFTYSAHPVPAAVALETLKIYEECDILAHVRRITPRFVDGLRAFADHPLVGVVRAMGLIGGVELVADKNTKAPFDPEVGIARRVETLCLEHGLITRPLGDVVTFSPPLIINEAEIDEMFMKFRMALDELAGEIAQESSYPVT